MAFHYKKALVTGGAGFIGSHLVDALVAEGCRVTVLDNLSTGNLANLKPISDRVNFIQGDIRDRRTLDQAMKGCDVVFHEAAVVSVVQTVEDPVGSATVNEMGALYVLESARLNGVRRAVFASSAAVYGDDCEVPNREEMQPRPKSPYAVQKLTNELYARAFHELYGLETVCLRYFNVFGPRQDPSSPYSGVISIFMDRSVSKSRPVIYGDGNQYRDFVYVRDVVQANLMAAVAENVGGDRFNVGTGRYVTINRLWEMISGLADLDMAPEYLPARPGDIIESVSSINRARNALGYAPEYTFEKGLEVTFEWYRSAGIGHEG